ncbi:hypothetical protein BC30090_p403 (plasmid) [Bacillus cereus]|uniref:hypothetical protein n=1 Tax=Bacillus TaxID=1386 RepID=UPI0013D6957D|nr:MULTISPECIES: hypothetical protein [Bacillus]NEL01372.1 hypothetical protein [Bacillus mobilis]BCD26930.1 hypothetical protein BC30090_p403 [Bacillus cereus]
MPRAKKEQQEKKQQEKEKKAYGRTVRADGNVAITVLCHPEEDADILQFFEKNTAVTYIAKEAIRQWMREQEKRHTANSHLDVASLVKLLQSGGNQLPIGFNVEQPQIPVTEEKVEETISEEAKANLKKFDF